MNSVIGKRLPRLDAIEKVTGEAKFSADIVLPGMLTGMLLRSPLPHARIVDVDVSRAKRLIGVKAIITEEDTPKIKFGHTPMTKDELPLKEKARYIGDEVAAVAATDEFTAREALDLIRVEYEPFPPIFDSEEAMKDGSPVIHEGIKNNIAFRLNCSFGDPSIEEADYIFNDRFETTPVQHCTLEPHVSIAHYYSSDHLILWSSTQSPFFLRGVLSETLQMPEEMIKVVRTYMGAGFGSKSDMTPLDFCSSLLSIKTRRPVKMECSRKEQFSTSVRRHPAIIDLKTGVKRDGTILAKEAKLILDNGAYSKHGPIVMALMQLIFASLYRVPNIKFLGLLVYTNSQPGGAFRGFGNPQITFAVESQMDIIAERLGMDSMELRLKNAVQSKDITPCKFHITSCGLRDSIEEVAKKTHWKERREKGYGIGMASCIHINGVRGVLPHDASSAWVKISENGIVSVFTGAMDIGQGSDTALAQIVAEELGLDLADIRMEKGDGLPVELGSYASRVTFIAGNAVKRAASEAKDQVFKIVADYLESNAEDLVLEDKKFYVKGSPDRSILFKEVIQWAFQKNGIQILGKGYYDPPTEVPNPETGQGNISPAYSFATHGVKVTVDVETGEVKVLNLVAAHDLGRAINPMLAEGQIEGALSQGIGFALTEELLYRDGQLLNPSFMDYKILNARDMPSLEPILIETMDPEGPFGAKGIGEAGLVPTAAAIANAIYVATGVRLKELPFSSEKILKAIK